MDVLKDKQIREYSYISRYAGFPFYYNTLDGKFIYGLTNQFKTNEVPYVLHKIKPTDNLDYLSAYYYGRPDFFWIIADFNHIQDPFINLSDYYTTLKIPSVADLSYRDSGDARQWA